MTVWAPQPGTCCVSMYNIITASEIANEHLTQQDCDPWQPCYRTKDIVRNALSQPHVVCSLGNPTPETLKKVKGEGRQFCALQDRLVVASARDTTQYNYPQWQNSSKAAVRLEGFGGSQLLTAATYNDVCNLFHPDLWIPLSDEVPAEAPEARVKNSVVRTLKWDLHTAFMSWCSFMPAKLHPIYRSISTWGGDSKRLSWLYMVRLACSAGNETTCWYYLTDICVSEQQSQAWMYTAPHKSLCCWWM